MPGFKGYRQSRGRMHPTISEPTPTVNGLHDAVMALKLAVEMLQGERGDKDDCAVTWGDLVDLGIVKPEQVPTDVGQKRGQ